VSDIVERLRKVAADYDDVGWHDDVLEAAAEIERLRKALEEIVALEYDHESMTDIARIALNGRPAAFKQQQPQGPVL
jgi:hypothetical protein